MSVLVFQSGSEFTGKTATAIPEPSPQLHADEASDDPTTYPVVLPTPQPSLGTMPVPPPLPTQGSKMSAEEPSSATQPAPPPLTASPVSVTDPPSRHESRCSHSTGGFKTDEEISKGQVTERALVAWSGEDDVGAHSDALDCKDVLPGQWNQFDANEQMFIEELCTTKLDPNSIPEEKRREAERIAREIEAGDTQSDGAYQNACGQEATVVTGATETSAAICKKEAAKPKAPPQFVFCVECGRPIAHLHGVGQEEDQRMRVPICGPTCMTSHDSNASWRAQPALPAPPASPPEDTGLNDAAWLTSDTGEAPAVDDEEHWELEPSTMTYAGDLEQAPSLIVPTHATPRYNALVEIFASTEDEYLLTALADLTVFDKLKYKPPYGSAEQLDRDEDEPYDLALRFEHFLEVTDTQRRSYIHELWSQWDARVSTWQSASTLIFTATDMKKIMKSWESKPETWSKNPHAQQGHDACHRNFHSFLFQLMGCKPLVSTFIKYPISSAQQPASLLRDFAENWQTWRASEERKAVRQMSEKKDPDDPTRRLGTQIYRLRRELQIGEEMQRRINRSWDSWYFMTDNEQRIYKEFTNGTIANKIREKQNMQKMQPAPFEGASIRMHALSQHWQPKSVQC